MLRRNQQRTPVRRLVRKRLVRVKPRSMTTMNRMGRMGLRPNLNRRQPQPVRRTTILSRTFSKPNRRERVSLRSLAQRRQRTALRKPATPSQPQRPVEPSFGWTTDRGQLSAYYRGVIRPRRRRGDLFNKQLRHTIITNMRTLNAKAMQPPELEFPKRLGQAFVISIRPERVADFRKRIGSWSRNVANWPGVDGRQLDISQLYGNGTLVPYYERKHTTGETDLRRGEIGCYLAHYRLWQHIVSQKIPHALILEDDANLTPSDEIVHRIDKMFDEIDRNKLPYDVLYLGNSSGGTGKRYAGTELAAPQTSQGTFSYCVTLAGAQKLVSMMMPMRAPIDEVLIENKDKIQQLALDPPLHWVVNVSSDTTNFR